MGCSWWLSIRLLNFHASTVDYANTQTVKALRLTSMHLKFATQKDGCNVYTVLTRLSKSSNLLWALHLQLSTRCHGLETDLYNIASDYS
jgi:hypothetical protein